MNLRGAVDLGSRQQRKAMLYVPGRHVDEDPVGHCRVPGCGAIFFRGEEQAWQRHVGECAKQNIDRIRAVLEHSKRGVPDIVDPEVDAHMRKVGKRMLAEGRMVVLPNERAGF